MHSPAAMTKSQLAHRVEGTALVEKLESAYGSGLGLLSGILCFGMREGMVSGSERWATGKLEGWRVS